MPSFKHIILADDDIDDIELFYSAAKECTHEIEIAAAKNGLQVIELLEQMPLPDVIILDLNMPKVTGYDCIKMIRGDRRFNNVPIMILTTSSSTRDIEYCLANGANCYVVKPSSFKALANVIKELSNGVLLNHLSR